MHVSNKVFVVNIGGVSYGLSLRFHEDSMSSDMYRLITQTICTRFPLTPVHCRSECPSFPNSLPLDRTATFFEYVIVEGKRYHASRTVGANKSSFVHVVIPGPSPANAYGEILDIVQVNLQFQQSGCPLRFVRMRWFKAWSGEREQLWDDL